MNALDGVLPGSIEETEILKLIRAGGSPAELSDLLAQHGLGGEYTGAMAVRESRELAKQQEAEEKDSLKQLDRAAQEIMARAKAGGSGAGPEDLGSMGDSLSGASFGGIGIGGDDGSEDQS